MAVKNKLTEYLEFTKEQQEQLQKFEDSIKQLEKERADFLQALALESNAQFIGQPIYYSRGDSAPAGILESVEVCGVSHDAMTIIFRTEQGICYQPCTKEEFIEVKQRELQELQSETAFKQSLDDIEIRITHAQT